MTATIIDDLLANRQMRNNDLTPFMFKKAVLFSVYADKV